MPGNGGLGGQDDDNDAATRHYGGSQSSQAAGGTAELGGRRVRLAGVTDEDEEEDAWRLPGAKRSRVAEEYEGCAAAEGRTGGAPDSRKGAASAAAAAAAAFTPGWSAEDSGLLGAGQPAAEGSGAAPGERPAAAISRAAAQLAALSQSLDASGLDAPLLHRLLLQAAPQPQQLAALQLGGVSDDVLLLLCRQVVSPTCSPQAVRTLLSLAALPKVAALQQSAASSSLVAALVHTGQEHGRALAQAVLAPVFQSRGLQPQQGQLVVRLAREALQPPARAELLLQLLTPVTASAADSATSAVSLQWTEAHVGVVQQLLDMKAALLPDAVPALLGALEAAVTGGLGSSVAFCKLLLTLATGGGGGGGGGAKLSPPQLGALARVAQRTKTFLTKSLTAKLAGHLT